jgi:hypothetical protein
MGHTIQFESHKGELPFIISHCEFPPNDDVLEYWDQPITLRIRYKNKNSRMISVNNTPDFFLMHPNAAGFVEFKFEENLVKLAKDNPNKFVLTADGTWRCPPGEAEAAKFGLYYKVFSSAEIDRKLYRNTVFLEDFLRTNSPAAPEQAKASILKIVSAQEGLSLSKLLILNAELGQETDIIYQLIASGVVYVDLRAEALINQDRVQVYTTPAERLIPSATLPKANYVDLKIGELINWGEHSYELANFDHHSVWLIGDEDRHPKLPRKHFEQLIQKGEIQQPTKKNEDSQVSWRTFLDQASPESVMEANRRHSLLMKYYQKEKLTGVPMRSIWRWSSKYKRAELLYGNGIVGLLPKWSNCGDRTERLSPRVMQLMTELIKKDYETSVQSGMLVVYGNLRIACAEIDESPPSYKTFVTYIHKRPKHEQDSKRMGSKAAYPSEPFYYYLDMDTPRHGDRPFEIGHIDHTLLDEELRDPITGQNFGRPWFSLLTDATSRRILVAYLVYEHPSYRTSMMVLRECVRRFGRLPQTVVTDGGSDFKSEYFECLAATFEITVKRRPKAKGRFGSLIENMFGITNKQFVYNLQGNTQLSHRDVRQVTTSHNPRELAVWTLGPLYDRLCHWAYERYDIQDHGTLKESPRSFFTRMMDLTGHRSHRRIKYDEDFLVLTLPTTRKGTAKNILNKGLKINNDYYQHPILSERELLEKQLPVKCDPYDDSVAWVYARGMWRKCLSKEHYQRRGLSEAELRISSAERAMRNTAFSRKLGERAEALAKGTAADRKQEKQLAEQLAILRAKEREDAQVRGQINGAFSNRSAPAISTNLTSNETEARNPEVVSPFDISRNVASLEEYV